MISLLKSLLTRWFGAQQPTPVVVYPTDEPAATTAPAELHPASPQLVAYDENLYDKAKTQWQFGDWHSLANMDDSSLTNHPEAGKLFLLKATAQSQLGNISDAMSSLKQAQQCGIQKKLIAKLLVSGVYNTLGKTALIAGQQQRALGYFEQSLSNSAMAGDVGLLVQARVQQNALTLISRGNRYLRSGQDNKSVFSINTINQINLGLAWAGNTINTVIFRHHGILTHNNIQYTAFYVDSHTLRLVQRDLASDTLKTFDLPGEYNLRDAHNSISMGIDRNGHLHISYDHHATQLRYRRSINPADISAWTEELPMTGANEEKVTYPTFILPRCGFPLTFLYRDGTHDKGTARIKIYDEAKQIWTNHPHPILSGSEQKPWTSNAYWNHPAVGTDGSLHLSFVWRTHTLGEEQRINNINIGYACSYDNGLTWQTSHKRSYKLPITQVNAETIHPVSPGSNLINQTSMALDSLNRPHIVFYADDPDDVPQYQHLWFDGKVWHHQIVSNRTQAFSLQGGGTLQIPISRPEIVIDRQDNVFIITRGDHTGNRMAATCLPAPDYCYLPGSTQTLCDQELGFAEPIIDRSRWQQDNILTLLLQNNQQPDRDIGHQNIQQTVTLVDIGLN